MNTIAITLSIRRALTLFATCLCLFGSQAQTPAAPKPGPEQQKMAVWLGTWTYKGQEYPAAIGNSGTFAGTDTHRFVLGGFFLEGRYKEKEGQGQGMIWYDAASKTYRATGYGGDGSVSTGSIMVAGNVWTETGTRVDAKGQSGPYRITTEFAADGKSGTTKAEISKDGGATWILWWDLTMKRSRK